MLDWKLCVVKISLVSFCPKTLSVSFTSVSPTLRVFYCYFWIHFSSFADKSRNGKKEDLSNLGCTEGLRLCLSCEEHRRAAPPRTWLHWRVGSREQAYVAFEFVRAQILPTSAERSSADPAHLKQSSQTRGTLELLKGFTELRGPVSREGPEKWRFSKVLREAHAAGQATACTAMHRGALPLWSAAWSGRSLMDRTSPFPAGLCPTLLAACGLPKLVCPFVPLYLGALALPSDEVFLFFVSPMTASSFCKTQLEYSTFHTSSLTPWRQLSESLRATRCFSCALYVNVTLKHTCCYTDWDNHACTQSKGGFKIEGDFLCVVPFHERVS